MKLKACLLAWLLGLTFGPVSAEPARPMFSGESLAPSEATGIVRSMGFISSTPPARNGLTYVVRAVGPRGRPVRVVIDARSGHVLSVRPIAALGAPYPQRSDDSARGPRRRPHADRQRHSADVPTGADVGVTWSSTVYNLAYMLRLWIVALYDALAGGTTAPRSFSHAIARNVTQEPPTCRIVAAATQEERTPIPAISQ